MESQLVELTKLISHLNLDLRYSTENNVTKRVLETRSVAKLDARAAQAFQRAADDFIAEGFIPVVWDAYRKPETQEQLLKTNNDQRYVRLDSNHLKGTAIDVTLATAKGALLDMGTDFDDFTSLAHIDSPSITSQQQENRKILQTIMEAHGFVVWPYEWWHFDYQP